MNIRPASSHGPGLSASPTVAPPIGRDANSGGFGVIVPSARARTARGAALAFLAVGALCLASGCSASNAVLDVKMQLPANPAGRPLFVRVLVGKATNGFEGLPQNNWVPEPHELVAVGTSTYEFSIEDPDIECDPSAPGACDLFIEVRFCLDRECNFICGAGDSSCQEFRNSDPQSAIRYRLERPMFVGQRTQWEPIIDTLPECVDGAATCAEVTAPTSSTLPPASECAVDDLGTGDGAPTWRCELDHCRHIYCAERRAGPAGQCATGGSMGPHLCDQ